MLSTISEDNRQHKGATQVTDQPSTELERWFKNLVFRGRNKPFAEVIEVTPDVAKLFLSGNKSNRAISKTSLDRICSDIEDGRWELNGETIIIANDGSMNDGQHRCIGVVKTGRPIRTMVMFGAARASRFTTDQGVVRTVGDMASMSGVDNGKAVATVAGHLWCYQQRGCLYTTFRGTSPAKRPTRTQVLHVISTLREDIVSAVERTAYNIPCGRTLGAFCRWVIEERLSLSAFGDARQAIVDTFFDRLTSGAGLPERDPILVARNALLMKGARRTPNERAQIVLVAWNDYRRGVTGKKFIKVDTSPGAKLPDIRK